MSQQSNGYLPYHEYLDLGFEPFPCETLTKEYPRFLQRASYEIDRITRHFYNFNDLETDVPFRRDKFKRAVGAQIEYFLELDGFTTSTLNNHPQQQQIGRTKLALVQTASASGDVEKREVLNPDVILHLEATGLLNRGIGR